MSDRLLDVKYAFSASAFTGAAVGLAVAGSAAGAGTAAAGAAMATIFAFRSVMLEVANQNSKPGRNDAPVANSTNKPTKQCG